MAGKKSFVSQQNPALAFISAQEEAPQQAEDNSPSDAKGAKKAVGAAKKPTIKASKAPEGFKANPLYVETKSRRMQLLVQPSLHEAIKARATAEGISVNELIHSILEAAIKGEE